MTLENFLKIYDTHDAVVLLQGKRNVEKDDIEKLISIGTLLTQITKNMLFRSGNSPGADFYFSEGVCRVAHRRL